MVPFVCSGVSALRTLLADVLGESVDGDGAVSRLD